MASPLMSLPRDLRKRIFELVLLSQGAATLVEPSLRDWKLDEDERRFPEDIESKYPPCVDVPDLNSKGDLLSNHPPVGSARNGAVPPSQGPFRESLSLGTIRRFEEIFRDYLNEMNDDEDDEDDEEDDGEDDEWEDDESEDEQRKAFRKMMGLDSSKLRHRNSRYKLETLEPINLALIRVNLEVYQEAIPIFYRSVNFVIETDPLSAMRFFKALPYFLCPCIETLTIPSRALMTDDKYARAAWSKGQIPPYNGRPTMLTPFGTFLAVLMPSWSHVYLYPPYGGSEDFYPPFAPLEMQMPLAHGYIQKLSLVFMGEDVAKDLKRGLSSQKCFDRMMGKLHSTSFAEHKFVLANPEPETSNSKAVRKWFERRDQYVKSYVSPFAWRWGDRNIDMRCSGNVQAVVELYLKDEKS